LPELWKKIAVKGMPCY